MLEYFDGRNCGATIYTGYKRTQDGRTGIFAGIQDWIYADISTHLHPELQQKMAQLIINLVNRGIPVWITTHSDTMLQHMNNMLKLKANKQSMELMKEYGYQRNDLLDARDVSMYQFADVESGKSKLECTQYGFVIPTFNDAQEQIVEEIYAFQED